MLLLEIRRGVVGGISGSGGGGEGGGIKDSGWWTVESIAIQRSTADYSSQCRENIIVWM